MKSRSILRFIAQTLGTIYVNINKTSQMLRYNSFQGILLTKRESLVFSSTMEISDNQFHTPMEKCEFNGTLFQINSTSRQCFILCVSQPTFLQTTKRTIGFF